MTTPIDIPPERANRPYVMGLAAGIAGSVILRVAWVVVCPPFSTAACVNSATAAVTWLAAIMLGLVALLTFLFGVGRRFTFAFFGAVLLCGVATRGTVLRLWYLPVGALIHQIRPVVKPIADVRKQVDSKAEWVATTSAQTLEGVHGVRILGALQQCAEEFRAADSVHSYPRNAADITSSTECSALLETRIDGYGPTRYVLGNDRGYRWRYTPRRSANANVMDGYQLRVAPDSLLGKPGPSYVSREDGVVVEYASAESKGVVAANPVAFLRDMRPCVAQLQAERKRRASRKDSYYVEPTPFGAASSACPDIALRLRRDTDGTKATVAFPLHERQGEFLDTAVVYDVRYVPLDIEGVSFELYAAPSAATRIPSGVRRYLIAGDGSVHVTREPRDPTVHDPGPAACEVEPGTPCGR
jgi:hypothetical protein